jgi:hypothetical protein
VTAGNKDARGAGVPTVQQERPGDRPATTYHQLARLGLDPLAPQVSTEIPPQPASSPWSSDPVPTEPPTGESIDAVRDVSKVGG